MRLNFVSYCRLLPPRQIAKLLLGKRMVGRGGGDRTLYPLNAQCFQRLAIKGQEHLLFIQNELAPRKPASVAACRPATPISRYITRRCEIGTWGTNPLAQVFQWLTEKGCLVSRRESEPFVELAYSFSC